MKILASYFISFTIFALGFYAIVHIGMYLNELIHAAQANPTGPHSFLLIVLDVIGLSTAYLIEKTISENNEA